ncbi:hypothetical protein AUJ84_01315 [Candidatus Pacearchaeota archaeon CG1_02_32_132]|nr:MAG: hypothetical protein AUJ84_01315 [Candidatus Pacearchaeota archaeon CG1_02_32_132]
MSITQEERNGISEAIYFASMQTTAGEEKRAFWFDKVILTSGKISVCFVDHRVLTGFPEYADRVVEGLDKVVAGSGADYIISSADAGIYWGARVAGDLGLGFVVMRKEGDLCGYIPKGVKVIGVDDLNTTLGTVSKLVQAVGKVNGRIDEVVVDLDREEYEPNSERVFKESGIKLRSLVTLNQLIDYGIRHDLIDSSKVEMVHAYRKDSNMFALDIINNNFQWVAQNKRLEKAREFYKNNPKVSAALEEAVARVA